jgi:hypothetical protein
MQFKHHIISNLIFSPFNKQKKGELLEDIFGGVTEIIIIILGRISIHKDRQFSFKLVISFISKFVGNIFHLTS